MSLLSLKLKVTHGFNTLLGVVRSLMGSVQTRATSFENAEGSQTVLNEFKDNSLLDSASILLTPTAVSDVKIHNIKPNTSTGDFDFTRATTATRVNSSGLIESVASGLPRIDFLGGTGQILLEPASTNTATYSNDFTQGDIFSGSANPSLSDTILTANQGTAPDGANTAFLLKDDNDSGVGQTGFDYYASNVVSDNFNTVSVFVKKSLSNNFIYIQTAGFDTAANGRSWFNIQNGTVGTVDSQHTAKIEDYGNGWFRCSTTFKTTTDLVGSVRFLLATADNTTNITKDGTNGVLLFGLQAEADASRNFATSYIPTSGSTVTRNADIANSSGDTSLISSTEGVLYAEVAPTGNPSVFRLISLIDPTDNTNRLDIGFTNTNNIYADIRTSGSSKINSTSINYNIDQYYKLAIKWSNTSGCSFYIGGTEIATGANTSFSASDFTSLNFKNIFDNPMNGKVKSVAVFKEALTDSELTCLTS